MAAAGAVSSQSRCVIHYALFNIMGRERDGYYLDQGDKFLKEVRAALKTCERGLNPRCTSAVTADFGLSTMWRLYG